MFGVFLSSPDALSFFRRQRVQIRQTVLNCVIWQVDHILISRSNVSTSAQLYGSRQIKWLSHSISYVWICAQLRRMSACASEQSDLSSLDIPWGAKSTKVLQAGIEDSDAQAYLSLRSAHMRSCRNAAPRLNCNSVFSGEDTNHFCQGWLILTYWLTRHYVLFLGSIFKRLFY